MEANELYHSGGIPSDPQKRRQALVVLASQTGDLPHIAAAAALDPGSDIIVIFTDEISVESRTSTLEYFTRAASATTVGISRVRHVILKDRKSSILLYNNLTRDDGKRRDPSKWISNKEKKIIKDIQACKFSDSNVPKVTNDNFDAVCKLLQYGGGREKADTYYTVSPVGATFIIAQLFSAAPDKTQVYETLAKRLSSDDAPLKMLADFQAEDQFKNVSWPKGDKPVILLWLRYTGGNTPTGHNPQGDSDLVGQKQLLALAGTVTGLFDVITIGHDPVGAAEKDLVHAKCHLGEFYKSNAVGSSRSRQLTFLLGLMQKYPGKLYQFGQKTGGMDAGAMAGIPTIYIEDLDSPTKSRMVSWTTMIPGYNCAMTEVPPSVLGKALRKLHKAKEFMPAELRDKPEVYRRAAMAYYLDSLSSFPPPNGATASFADSLQSAKVADAKQAQAQDADIAKKVASLQTDGFYVRGYNVADMEDPIKVCLIQLVRDYSKGDVIIRNQEGKYVKRSAS